MSCFPIKDSYFHSYVSLPEGKTYLFKNMYHIYHQITQAFPVDQTDAWILPCLLRIRRGMDLDLRLTHTTLRATSHRQAALVCRCCLMAGKALFPH